MDRRAVDLLERTARRIPHKTAVVDEHGSVTFAELRTHARRIASGLIARGHGNRPVVVVLEKGADALAAMLGALYAGGCYVPVDPIAAPTRLEAVCCTLEAPPVIVDERTRPRASSTPDTGHILDVRELAQTPEDEAALDVRAERALGSDPAYILFTSGSTGTPKGVMVSHQAILSFIGSFTELFGIDETDVIGNQAPFDFDVSVKDIYASLATGATLVVLPRRLFNQPAALVDALNEHRVTTLTWAVAALCLITSLHGLDYADLPCVRRVLFSGETMPLRHLRAWLAHLPQADFVNLYGPTEVTCNCLYHRIDRAQSYASGIPLGSPFPNHEVLLLDEHDLPVTRAGATGELVVRSPELALGYVGCAEATAASFDQNPLRRAWPERVYRTGDLAELTAAGELIFRGRRDNQIKHLGHRVELEEIDLALERLPGVSRCRCAYDERRHRIYAFYEGATNANELARQTQDVLPAHLIPSACVPVAQMPLSKNGKVDRAALLAAHMPERHRHARTQTEGQAPAQPRKDQL